MKPLKIPTKQDLYKRIRAIVRQEIQSVGPVEVQATGATGISKGIIPAAYVSGNPQIQQAHETATTLGTKTYKVTQAIGNRAAALAASDSIDYGYDPDGNKFILGKIVDVGSGVIDADYFMGLRPVAPGNTLLLTANTEQSTNSATPVTVKRFFVTRPGRYRVKFALSRDGGTTTARVGIELPNGTVIAASANVDYLGTVYPTFSSQQTADMTVTIGWGMLLVVQLSNSSGPTSTGYIKDVTVNYTDATAALAAYDAVLVD